MKTPSTSLLLALLLTGCASRQPFGYSMSPTPSGSVAGRTVEVLPVSDTRTNHFIDRHFTTNLLDKVREAVAREVESTGLFRPQVTLALTPALSPKETEKNGALTQAPSPLTPLPSDGRGEPKDGALGETRPTLTLKTELKRAQWEVPHYDAILGNTFLLSFFTGGIGGGIYISTSTQVNGFVVVQFELTEAPGGRVLLNKEYSGFHTEKMAKASCDSSTTKRRMATEAFKDAMTQFKADLVKLSSGPPL